MICQHDYIITFRTLDGEPVMWACSNCKLKFVPFSQLLTEVAEERKECAQVCEELGTHKFQNYVASDFAYAIRTRGNNEIKN